QTHEPTGLAAWKTSWMPADRPIGSSLGEVKLASSFETLFGSLLTRSQRGPDHSSARATAARPSGTNRGNGDASPASGSMAPRRPSHQRPKGASTATPHSGTTSGR